MNNQTTTLAEALDAAQTRKDNGNWIPASGGTETPFVTRSGLRLQYLYQPTTGRHVYINLDTDIFLTDAEADCELR